jgi:hypothetical protein
MRTTSLFPVSVLPSLTLSDQALASDLVVVTVVTTGTGVQWKKTTVNIVSLLE